MCDPIKAEDVSPDSALQNALCEIVSAQSALNMYPDPIYNAHNCPTCEGTGKYLTAGADGTHGYCHVCDGTGRPKQYLSECDGWAKHAMEHLHASFALVNKASLRQESLKNQVYKLVCQLRKANMEPCVITWLDEY